MRTTMGAWGPNSIIKDVLAHEIVRDLNVDIQDYQPVIVFINGEYWGIQTIRDRLDQRYIEYTHNIDKDSLEFEHWWSNHYRELIDHMTDNDLQNDIHYEQVKTYMDVDRFIDYQIGEMFLKNYDWPANNLKAWRPNTATGKWQWLFFDLDGGFGDYTYNIFEHCTLNEPLVSWPNPPFSTFIFRNLLKNDPFKTQFINRYAALLNSTFQIDTTLSKLNEIKLKYSLEIPRHIARWHFPENYETWEDAIHEDLLVFLEERPCVVEEHILDFFNLDHFEFDCQFEEEEEEEPDSLIQYKNRIIIAPNPNNGIFYIQNDFADILYTDLKLQTIAGKTVYSKNNLQFDPGEKKQFDFSELPDNVYLLSFYLRGQQVNKRLIILK